MTKLTISTDYGTVVFNDVSSLDSYVSEIIFGLLDFLGTIPGLCTYLSSHAHLVSHHLNIR